MIWKIIGGIYVFVLGMFLAVAIIALGLLIFTDEPTMFGFWIREAAK